MKLLFSITLSLFVLNSVFSQISESSSTEDIFSNDVKEEVVIRYYPNPAKDYLNVVIENGNFEKPDLSIYSLIGNQVKAEIENPVKGKFTINIENIPSGYYFLSVRDQKTKFNKTYKFLKR